MPLIFLQKRADMSIIFDKKKRLAVAANHVKGVKMYFVRSFIIIDRKDSFIHVLNKIYLKELKRSISSYIAVFDPGKTDNVYFF